MNISYSELKKYIDIDLSAREVGNILTSIGLEVEGIHHHESVPGGLEGVCIGKVLTCEPHLQSDHLHITTVDLGVDSGGVVQIVCGAPNIAAGQTVPVATIGTVLHTQQGDFKIKKSKIRGVESFGMICSAKELGVGEDSSGILILPEDIPAGTPAKEYFDLYSDTIIEIDITPNRSDATSHYGVARELYAYLKTRGVKTALHRPAYQVEYADASPLPVSVEAPQGCLRYCGVVMRGVNVGESPQWLRDALMAIGQKPINSVVDVTNYVLFAIGQPLHAFDLNRVSHEICVRWAKEGETLVTLDGVERKLTPSDLVIADDTVPLCLAGVIGGERSGVGESTTDIFIESAHFHPTTVRKTARRHAVSTDSSFRFERGLDPKATDQALSMAVALIQRICGGEVVSRKYDILHTELADRQVTLSVEKVQKLTGISIPEGKVREILQAMEIQVLSEADGVLELLVPAYRYDVVRDVDVIEEILRIYGYDQVPIPSRLRGNIQSPSKEDRSFELQRLLSEQLVGQGFVEVLNNSLSKEAYYSHEQSKKCVHVLNALSSELSVMRHTLLMGGLENIAHNLHRQQSGLRLFEYGKCYTRVDQDDASVPVKGYDEEHRLGIWMTGDQVGGNWITSAHAASPFELKAVVYHLLSRVGVSTQDPSIVEESVTNHHGLSTGVKVSSHAHGTIVEWGVVESEICRLADIDCPVYYAEISWDTLMILAQTHKTVIREIPKYPSVKRDFALLVDKEITFDSIKEVAMKAEKRLLRKVILFDVYENPSHLPQGKKSYAVSFELRDDDKTLSDKAIQAAMNRIYDALSKELGAVLR